MPLSNAQWFTAGVLKITGSNTANPTMEEGSATSYTFDDLSLGAEDASRIIVIAMTVGWSSHMGTVTGVTVGGSACTQQVEASGDNGTTENVRAEIWSIALATGTTGDVVCSFSGATGNRGGNVSVYRLVGDVVLAPDDTAKQELSQADSDANASVDVDAKDGGFIVAVSCRTHGGLGGSVGANCSWAGVTESTDQGPGGSSVYASTGYHSSTSDDGSYTVAPTWHNITLNAGLSVASWHPQ
jgi:hypothetical protein